MFSLSLLAALTGYAVLASGLKLPLTRRNIHRSISARDDNHPVSDPNDPFNFQKVGGFYYSTTIHINGQPFEVDLDTGSSDLWIDTAGANLTGSIDIGIPASIGYEDLSSATGNLTLTDMKWGNYTVKDQIFINAPGSDATLGGLRDGVLGLGPAPTSHIIQTVSFQNVSNTSYARTLTDNIFSQYPDKPSYITFLLSRGNNSDDVMDGGDFTIGETVKGHEDILTAPKLPIIHRTGRWISFIDGLTVNGELIKWTSVGLSKMLLPDPPQIPVPEGKFIATFDTGISYTILPRPVVEAIFKDIPIVKLNGMEYIDCSTKVNFSINIGNSEYAVHPLDLVVPILLDEDGTVKCRPGLSPTDSDLFGDFQFGDSVLRNLYTLFNFGNWTRPGDVQPYIQITSVTDKEKAWAEFDSMQDARIQQLIADQSNSTSSTGNNTNTTTATQSPGNTSASQTINTTPLSTSILSTPTDAGSKNLTVAGALLRDESNNVEEINSLIRNSYIIIGLLVAAILLLIGGILLSSVRKLAPRSNPRYKEIVPPGSEFEVLSGPSGRYSD